MTSNNITERAMLVNLTISQWTAVRNDKQVTREVAINHQSQENMGRYNKSLVDKKALEAVAKIASAARAEHYRRTLPWRDGGDRILSSVGYFDYAQVMREFIRQYLAAVAEFCRNYPRYVREARIALNGLFRIEDYPSESKIAQKFAMAFDVLPMPEGKDFRVQLGDIETAKIRAEIESQSQVMIERAMADVWERMRDVVARMSERLKAYTETAEGKISNPFRDSLVNNITELLDILPSLNITSNQDVTRFAREMRESLTLYSPDELRSDPARRSDVAARADEILAKMSAFLA